MTLRILALTLLIASLSAETLQEVFQGVRDWSQVCIVAPDGQFLGTLDPNPAAQLSVFNPYGPHGNRFSPTSILNEYGAYGGKFGQHSPFNTFCPAPPSLVVGGRVVAVVSDNRFVRGVALSPLVVMALPSMFPTR